MKASKRLFSYYPSLMHNRFLGVFLLTLSITACEPPELRWLDNEAERTTNPSPLAHPPFVARDSTLVADSPAAAYLETQDLLREAGAISLLEGPLDAIPESRERLQAAVMIPSTASGVALEQPLGSGVEPIDANRCARTLRMVTAGGSNPSQGHGQVAAWWSKASGGRVLLVAAWRDSVAGEPMTSAWRGPIPVDTLDQGPRDAQASDHGAYGCARPAPGLAVDSINGYVHIAYALTGPEGPGIFYAHQMTPHALFEPPIAVIYGTELGEVRVASDGDLVAVVYDDPNSRKRGQIGMAVSTTAGHVFGERFRVSEGTADARDPYIAVRGRALVVGWSAFTAPDAEPLFMMRRAVVP